MQAMTVHAPAKLNLFLHITGKRADGYHLLESLVVFTSLADVLTIDPASALSLRVTGEFADAAGAGDGNLVLKAAHTLREATGYTGGAALTLEKNIPVGAGLGGGSADAAAALRGLNAFWQLGWSDEALHSIAITLGADVAMCLNGAPAIARGIGEQLSRLTQPLPPLHAVLVHPRVPLLTSDVYAAFTMPPTQERLQPSAPWPDTLATTRNDLQHAAIRVDARVAEVLLALETLQPPPQLVRMSGSGACCFALYTDGQVAAKLAATMTRTHPVWWVKAVRIEG